MEFFFPILSVAKGKRKMTSEFKLKEFKNQFFRIIGLKENNKKKLTTTEGKKYKNKSRVPVFFQLDVYLCIKDEKN